MAFLTMRLVCRPFAVLGSLGLDNILIREMVKSPDKENIFLGSHFIETGRRILIVIFSVGVIVLTKPNDPLSPLVLIVAASMFFSLLMLLTCISNPGSSQNIR